MKTSYLKPIKSFKKNKKLFGLVFLVVVLPLIVILTQTVTKLRPKAAPALAPQSYLMFEPKTDKTVFGIGEELAVDVVLDSKSDSMTVMGADLVISYPPQLTFVSADGGEALGNLIKQHVDGSNRVLKLSAANTNIKDEQGYPTGGFNSRGILTTLKFKVVNQGKGKLDFDYQSASTTNDTNVIGFEKQKLVSQQAPKERLLRQPGGWSFEAKQATPSPYPSHTTTPSATPKPTPLPSPWLPSPSPSPQPRPKAQIQLQLTFLDRYQALTENIVNSKGDVVRKPDSKEADHSTPGILYGINTGQVKGVMIASQFGDMIEEIEQKKVSIEYVEPSSEETQKFPPPETEPPAIQPNLVKLAQFNTDDQGRATVEINKDYEGQKMFLFVRTPSHLLKASQQQVTVPRMPECLPYCQEPIQVLAVKFDNLIPGDIYIAENQTEQDNLINSFDALELIRNLGKTARIAMPDFQCIKAPCSPPPSVIRYHKADLNADEVVNIRDLKILLNYLGQTGDSYQSAPQDVTYCQTDQDCQVDLKCYQPPMPTCPEGFGCIQVMPQKYCRQWGN